MQIFKTSYSQFAICFLVMFIFSCKGKDKVKEADIIEDPREMNERVATDIEAALEYASANSDKIDSNLTLGLQPIVNEFYNRIEYKPIWSNTTKWLPLADSLFNFIATAENEGLFPADYHYMHLKKIRDSLGADSLARMNAILWTRADLLLTDGFMHIIKHLKQGRLQADSLSLNKDSVLVEKFFIATLNTLLEKQDLTGLLNSLQPKHTSYWELKKGIKRFVDSMDRTAYTPIKYPFKKGNAPDSIQFIRLLHKRLAESNCIVYSKTLPDSTALLAAIKKYQQLKGLKTDGKYGRQLINSLNNNDVDNFKRIAINLDRYKHLPEKMPEKYIWVNLPGYYLWMVDADTVVFESKVICGTPATRTPLLTSKITNMITYPTWTVPNSIIVKQYLPKLKNNPNYLTRIGLKLVSYKGEEIDPNTINWSKYSRGIPYKVMQNSGDNNSLGVIKFNFSNPYDVYLHDTNQRYLFKNDSRALSHGCVRVQDWQKLAYYIAGNDSLLSRRKDSLRYTADSIKTWIAKKERHQVTVQNQVPLYIRYFSCEGRNGLIRFYEDIYGEDRLLIEKYFARR